MTESWSFAIDVIGWTLLHFVWQGLAAAAVLGVALQLVPRRRAAVRYVLACGALAAMAVLPAATARQLAAREIPHGNVAVLATLPADDAAGAATAGVGPTVAAAPHAPETSLMSRIESSSVRDSLPPLPLIVALWLIGVTFASLRLAGGWWRVQRLLRSGACQADATSLERVQHVAHRMGLARRVRVLESARVHVPMVIGCLRPALLLPASALTGLTPRQLEALLAHELAHIARHDYLVNLLQSALETLLFYHPAVWWVSHTIRVEREHCCDDLAVAACGDAVLYARALTELETRCQDRVGIAMAASSGSLISRVRRLVDRTPSRRFASSAWVVAAITALMVAGAGAIGWMQEISRLMAETAHAPVPSRPAVPQTDARARLEATRPGPSVVADAQPNPGAARPVSGPDRASPPELEAESSDRAPDVARTLEVDTQRFESLARELESRAREIEKRVQHIVGDVTASVEVQALVERAHEIAEAQALTDAKVRELDEMARALAETATVKALKGLEDFPIDLHLSSDIQARVQEIEQRAQEIRERAHEAARRAGDSIDAARIEQLLRQMRALERTLERVLDDALRDRRPVITPAPAPAPNVAPGVAPAPRAQPRQPAPPSPAAKPEVGRQTPGEDLPPAPPAPPAPRVPAAPVVTPPAVPAPPAPPAPPEPGTIDFSSSDVSWNTVWSQDGTTTRMQGKGRIELTDDDSDVRRLDPDGFFIIEQHRGWLPWRSGSRFEARSRPDGAIARRYQVDGKEVSADEGRAWLRTFLPPLARNVGFGARDRVARLLKRSGPDGVLREIALISSDSSRKSHYVELFGQSALDPTTLARALEQAGRTMTSAYELGRVLAASADRFVLDDVSGAAYAKAARRIRSDFELRRALEGALAQPELPKGAVAELLRSAVPGGGAGIDSDFEMAELLIRIPGRTIDRAPVAYFEAVPTISSDFERKRVLLSQAARRGLGPERIATIATLTNGMGSDFERAEVLLAIVARQALTGQGKDAVLAAARRIGSEHERGRVLSAMLQSGALAASASSR